MRVVSIKRHRSATTPSMLRWVQPINTTSFVVVAVLCTVILGSSIGCCTCHNAAVSFAFTKIPKSLRDDRHAHSDRRNRYNDPTRKTKLPSGGIWGKPKIIATTNDDDDDDESVGSSSSALQATTGMDSAGAGPGNSNDVDNEESNDNNGSNDIDGGARTRGRLLLLAVACLYGTLNVMLRFVYDVPEIPPTAAALSATRGWLAFLCFLPPLWVRPKSTTTPTASTPGSGGGLLRSGLELATWGFLAQGLLNVGLVSTGSARASFLTQTSVLFTPLIATSIGKQSVGRRVWSACWVALAGLLVLTLGGGGGATTSALAISLSKGDAFVLGGALSWSMYLFRLSTLGPNHPGLLLQGVKTGGMAILYSIWWMGSALLRSSSTPVSLPSSSWWKLPSWMASGWVVWTALFASAIGPGTIADVLQQKAQAHVSPSEANILLSAEPVFATIFAAILLGETSSLLELAGGALILVAAMVASA